MHQYKKIILAISLSLFTLLAFLSIIMIDLNDREFPQSLKSKSKLYLNFFESGLSNQEAFLFLEELNDELQLGLLKIAPNMANKGEGKIYISFDKREKREEVSFFRKREKGFLEGKDRLQHSLADGSYLVTKSIKHLDEFEKQLIEKKVEYTRQDQSLKNSLSIILYEQAFGLSILASLVLISTLALFWLALRSYSRAMRVLAGCPRRYIQIQDLIELLKPLALSGGIATLFSSIYILIWHGWLYLANFLTIFICLKLFLIGAVLITMMLLSISAWPSTKMLANRKYTKKTLKHSTFFLQMISLLLLATSVAPSWKAYLQAAELAEEMKLWNRLSDQVALSFQIDYDEMESLEPLLAEFILEAEKEQALSLSYTYTKDLWPLTDFGEYQALAFVNQTWLNLVTEKNTHQLQELESDRIPDQLLQEIKEEIEVLSRNQSIEKLKFLQTNENFKVALSQGGGGERLNFYDSVLLVLLPSVYDFYDDSNLTSILSSSNISFTSLKETEKLLKKHGLNKAALKKSGIKGGLNIIYLAEGSILQAQYASYLAHLQALALLVLALSFTVNTILGAWIHASLHAKRNFILLLHGRSRLHILKKRLFAEGLFALALVLSLSLLQKGDEMIALYLLIAYSLLIIPLSHLFALSWSFHRVRQREID